jgi:UDP-glucose 4-epimerase
LERRGLSHHEVVHRVASVLVGEIWHVMHEKRPFDPARYTVKLAEQLQFRPSHLKSSTSTAKRRPRRRR